MVLEGGVIAEETGYQWRWGNSGGGVPVEVGY